MMVYPNIQSKTTGLLRSYLTSSFLANSLHAALARMKKTQTKYATKKVMTPGAGLISLLTEWNRIVYTIIHI